MDQDRTWNLFALKLTGKASPEEWAELQLLIEDRPELAMHLQALTNFWHRHSKYDKERIEKAVKKIAMNYALQNEIPVSGKRMVKQEMDQLVAGMDAENNQNRFVTMLKRQVKYFFAVIFKRSGRHKTNSKANSLTG
ncbi:MAG: hypothetical protein JWM28_3525 [Chitinophagaceae bacterium]|nr:hypothetical protein [Chitinophagaceae bacterium]